MNTTRQTRITALEQAASPRQGIADAIRGADRKRREGAPNPEAFSGGAIAAAIRKARQALAKPSVEAGS
jgi:hypothetical protein